MKNIKVLGIDLAKNVFQIHGTDAKGKCVLKKRLSREKLPVFIATSTRGRIYDCISTFILRNNQSLQR